MGLSQILESAFCYLQQSLFYYYFNMYIRRDRLLKGGENMKVWVSKDKYRLPMMVEAKILVGAVKAILDAAETKVEP